MAPNTQTQPPTRIQSHRDLEVYQRAFEAAMEMFQLSKSFPREEVYFLTSQIRRSTRSVAANIAEGWRKRRYKAAFISKLSDAESEAAETQVHIEFARKCKCLDDQIMTQFYEAYEQIIRTLVGMIHHADRWTLPRP